MTSATETHVIVGASLAGAKAAETLRAEGFDGRVLLIGAERHRPYERPLLSKQVLRGEAEAATAFVHPYGFYDEHDIELQLGTRIESIDVQQQLVEDQDGRSTHYDRLLLATGSRPRRLPIPGADLEGIHYLRDMTDVAALRRAVSAGARVAVVGAGWIGSEVAASLRQLGAEVSMIDPAPTPLHAVMGHEVGAMYAALHAEHGVSLHMGTGVERFIGDGSVTGVGTSDDSVVEADIVVVGVGASPRIELARRAGLAVDGGVVVDEHLRTSAPNIYAAGDVATAMNPTLGFHVRVEHWANALNQGVSAAKSMLGQDEVYDRLPYFFSDQYDLGMEYSGHAPAWDRVVIRGDVGAREIIAFWLAGGRVAAAMNANVWDVVEPLKALITSQHKVSVEALADPDVPLDELAEAGAGAR